MRSKMLPVVALVAVVAAFFLASSCGNGPGSVNCPVCGTTKNGTYRVIDIIPVPEHNPTGEPGGPFNSFDISSLDPIHHTYFVSDRIGLDIPVINTITDIAITAIGGDNTVAAGFTPSPCDPTIPFTITGMSNQTRFGCRTAGFALGAFGPSGDFGGFPGAQCCASRSNNVNPMGGPDGQILTPDGLTLFVGNGSSSVVVFDLAPLYANPPGTPTVIANIPLGTSADYDGPAGIGPCIASWNGRAGSDQTCGDTRSDEMSLSTPLVNPEDQSTHTFLMVDNGDPGLPFVSVVDVTQVLATRGPANCLPFPNPTAPYNPITGNMPPQSCVVGQIYYDGFPTNDPNSAAEPCPDPSVFFNNNPATPVPTGNPYAVCVHAPIAPAGLGGSTFNPLTGHFLTADPNSTGDPRVGEIDEVDPFAFINGGPPIVRTLIVQECMPSGLVQGPGTDFLITCENHDGMTFQPSEIFINGKTLTFVNGTQTASQTQYVGGVDQATFDPVNQTYFLAARDMPTGAVLGVIDGPSRLWLQNVPTNSNSHSIAVDSANHHVFVPSQTGGICTTQSANGCVLVMARE